MRASSPPQKILKILPSRAQKGLPRKIHIVEISDPESRKINRQYRGRSQAANVLSFRYSQDYGEILLCPAVIRREAKEQRNTYQYQKKWMIVHGLLHLAGLHHEKSLKSRKKFERIEQKLLRYDNAKL